MDSWITKATPYTYPTASRKPGIKDKTEPMNHPMNTELFFFLIDLLQVKIVDVMPVSCRQDPNTSSVPRMNEGTKQTES